jgi:hypothetical protein
MDENEPLLSVPDPSHSTADVPPSGVDLAFRDTPSLQLVDERVVRPLINLLEPPFPFSRKLNHLMISVHSGGAWVTARINGTSSRYSADWPQGSASLQEPVLNLRAALDGFRQRCSSYLNTVAADDLLAQLSTSSSGSAWEHATDPSPQHEAAWHDPDVQDALHILAWHGYAVFESVFKDERLREDVLSLSPGDRLEVHWYPENGRQHQLPWGLLYARPANKDNPVDPEQFLGLRFRLEAFSYTQDRVKLCLGALREQTPRAYCLYWDDSPTEISSEVRRQRGALDRWPGRLLLPTNGVPTPRDELLAGLNRREPNPHVLYVFCRCRDLGNASLELRFSNGAQESPIRMPDLNQVNLRDNPLVFINACDTAAAESGGPQDLERYYFARKCGAYIGTEAKVPVQLASRVAEGFFHYFYGMSGSRPLPVGEALAHVKRLLWRRYRNVGGIFYVLINEPQLYVDPENQNGHDISAQPGG